MTQPMCFEILPILCTLFYRVSIARVYMSAVSYLPPSNDIDIDTEARGADAPATMPSLVKENKIKDMQGATKVHSLWSLIMGHITFFENAPKLGVASDVWPISADEFV